jgi:ubiquinone/menaquinone biosynthesis C-methylase UbiE
MGMAVVLDPEETETRVIHTLVDFTGADVLDVGCGDGRMTWRFAAPTRSVLGLDPEAKSIATAQTSMPAELVGKVTFQVADITSEELPRAAFDMVVLSWSLC